jgi:hypothetical protein
LKNRQKHVFLEEKQNRKIAHKKMKSRCGAPHRNRIESHRKNRTDPTPTSYANLRDFGKGFHLKTMNPVSTTQQQYQNAPVPPRHNAWMARDSSREQAKQQQQQIATPPPSGK